MARAKRNISTMSTFANGMAKSVASNEVPAKTPLADKKLNPPAKAHFAAKKVNLLCDF
jgi:hypothetical protein